MDKKKLIRKKFFVLRKKKYFNISEKFFFSFRKITKKSQFKNKINISIYYPSSYEVNILKILEVEYFKNSNFFLPIVGKNNTLDFYKWKKIMSYF